MNTVKYLLLFVLFTSISFAQTIGGSVMLGLPQGEFKEKIDRLGYGFNVQGTLWEMSPDRPFTIGANLGYLIYGEESERRSLGIDIPGAYVDVNRTNSLACFHLLFQVSPFSGAIRPYAEGLFGGAYIFTQTSVESDWSDENLYESTNFDDFTWNYGFGGGFLIALDSDPTGAATLFLDLKVRYKYGTEAEYLKEGSIDIINGDLYYDVQKSKTDLLTIHIGVTAAIF